MNTVRAKFVAGALGAFIFLSSAVPCNALQFVNSTSGSCIEVRGGNVTDGTPIDIYPCTGSPNQNWIVGAGQITGIGGSCLDVQQGAVSAAAPVILVACNGRASQKWSLSNGQIVGLGGRCLDVKGGGKVDS